MIDELIVFLRDISTKGDSFFIEAEGKPEAINNFIVNYNVTHMEQIDDQSEGIILLENNANKWGLELRLYVPETPPSVLLKIFTRNTVYRSEYKYRLNDNGTISELLRIGYQISLN